MLVARHYSRQRAISTSPTITSRRRAVLSGEAGVRGPSGLILNVRINRHRRCEQSRLRRSINNNLKRLCEHQCVSISSKEKASAGSAMSAKLTSRKPLARQRRIVSSASALARVTICVAAHRGEYFIDGRNAGEQNCEYIASNRMKSAIVIGEEAHRHNRKPN